jgi:putative phage-type endonuclease
MSASKIAAVVGLSPYESRFSLWHKMAGQMQQEPQNEVMARGHYLEPAIIAWFSDQHPDFDVTTKTAYAHHAYPHFTASPDGDMCRPDGPAILEVKADDSPEWDAREGMIPKGYYAQVQWQLACVGLDTAYVARLGEWLRFEEYVIVANPPMQQWLLDEATAFMDTLPTGVHPQRPNLDSHTATYEAVRKLHPGIDPSVKVDVPVDLWNLYDESKGQLDLLKASHQRAKSTLLDLMGDARIATCAGTDVLRRQPGKGGSISLYPVTRRTAA